MQTELLGSTEPAIAQAAALLRAGEVVAIPTETVYGLAASALTDAAVRKIFAAKGRPQDNPLISHISSMEMLPMIVREVPETAKKLAAAFWPGPLTIILPRSKTVADAVCAGLDT
ncbi:MAG: L-threonylcarbamoyladenylate synthase, partial [Ruthenibacterium sp.]